MKKAMEENQALVEQEWSATKEACQTLVLELDSSSTMNKELQKELEVAYQAVVELRKSSPQAFEAPLRAILNQGTQMGDSRVWGSSNRGVLTATNDGIGYPCSHPRHALASANGKTGKMGIPYDLCMLTDAASEVSEESSLNGQGTLPASPARQALWRVK